MNTKIIAILMASIVAMAIAVPMAIGVDTTANIDNVAPHVCQKWEEPDDDGTTGGTQVMPNTWPNNKTVMIKACACDGNGNGDINTVTATVTGPGASPKVWSGIVLNPEGGVDCTAGGCDYAGVDCTGYNGTFEMEPCDPAGTYTVVVTVTDASGATDTDTNTFEYLGKTVLFIDFGAVAYGAVQVNVEKDVLGDGNTGTAAAPTVHNKGNDDMAITITATEMTPGGVYDVTNVDNEDMRQNATVVGATGVKSALTAGNPIAFGHPFVCNTPQPIDFSINAIPGTKGAYTGEITIEGAKA